MNQTYHELLNATDGVFSPNNKFIEINKRYLIYLNMPDYDFFWGCMKLYDTYGVNYFKKYIDIVIGKFGDFSDGFESWLEYFGMTLKSVEGLNDQILQYHDKLSQLIKWLYFFNFSHYGGVSVQFLENLLNEIPELYQDTCIKLSQQNIAKNEFIRKYKYESYYNFKDFSTEKFDEYVSKCTKHKNENMMTIDDAITIAKNSANSSFITIFIKNGQICFMGKTENLLTYIGSKNKKYTADSVILEEIDKTYIDDVLLATKIFFNYPLDGVKITKANRKFVTTRHASFVYREFLGFSNKQISDIICDNLPIIYLKNKQRVIDKLALEQIISSNKF